MMCQCKDRIERFAQGKLKLSPVYGRVLKKEIENGTFFHDFRTVEYLAYPSGEV